MVSECKVNYPLPMDDWKLIAAKLNDDGFGLNLVRTMRKNGREVWCADVNREGKRWIVHAEDPASAFLELERQTRLDDFVFR